MSQEFTLIITISEDGETATAEVNGIKGRKCSDVAKMVEELGEVIEHRHTADYDQPEPVALNRTGGRLRIGG